MPTTTAPTRRTSAKASPPRQPSPDQSSSDQSSSDRPSPRTIAPSSFSRIANVYRLLSDETRLRILAFLRDGERHVTDICNHLGQSQPAVSHHLALLRVADIIVPRRDGKHNYYSINTSGVHAEVIAGMLGAMAAEG